VSFPDAGEPCARCRFTHTRPDFLSLLGAVASLEKLGHTIRVQAKTNRACCSLTTSRCCAAGYSQAPALCDGKRPSGRWRHAFQHSSAGNFSYFPFTNIHTHARARARTHTHTHTHTDTHTHIFPRGAAFMRCVFIRFSSPNARKALLLLKAKKSRSRARSSTRSSLSQRAAAATFTLTKAMITQNTKQQTTCLLLLLLLLLLQFR
jgi:hypothetical protein